jgi:transcription antitermination factor NusG
MGFWVCAQLQPQRERLALHCLTKVNRFEIYSPRVPVTVVNKRRKDPPLDQPLFPGYCFVLIELQWHQARWSPGVVRLVSEGATPTKVPDHIIDTLRRREHNGVIQLPKAPGPRAGAPVRVLGGPLAGNLGLYAGMKPRQRIEILLTMLGSQQRVTLSRGDVEIVPSSA